jgi:hypothetical protein
MRNHEEAATLHPAASADDVVRRVLLSSSYDHRDDGVDRIIDVRAGARSEGPASCLARLAIVVVDAATADDGAGEEKREGDGDDDGGSLLFPFFDDDGGGLIMFANNDGGTDDDGVFPVVDVPCGNLLWGADDGEEEEEEREGGGIYEQRDDGCAIEFEFRCDGGGGDGGEDGGGADVVTYEAGFDYVRGGGPRPSSGRYDGDDDDDVEFLLNGRAMTLVDVGDAAGGGRRGTAKGGVTFGSRRRERGGGAADALLTSANATTTENDLGWNTMRLAIGVGGDRRTKGRGWVLIGTGSLACFPVPVRGGRGGGAAAGIDGDAKNDADAEEWRGRSRRDEEILSSYAMLETSTTVMLEEENAESGGDDSDDAVAPSISEGPSEPPTLPPPPHPSESESPSSASTGTSGGGAMELPPTLLPDTDDSTPSHATLDTDAGMVFQTPYMEDAEATTTTTEEEAGQVAAADDDESESVPIIEMPSKYLPETDDSTPYVILDTDAQIIIQTPYMENAGATTTAEEEVGQAAAADNDDSESVPIINMPSKYLPETDDSTPYVILDTEAQIVIQTSYMKGDGGEVRGKTCSAVFYSSTHNIL